MIEANFARIYREFQVIASNDRIEHVNWVLVYEFFSNLLFLKVTKTITRYIMFAGLLTEPLVDLGVWRPFPDDTRLAEEGR